MGAVEAEKLSIGGGIFTTNDVSEILDIKRSRVSYLVRAYTEHKFQQIANYSYVIKSNNRKVVNFLGLIELKVFDELRNLGISSHKILQGYEAYAKEYNTNYPFAKKQVLLLGKKIIMDLGGSYIETSGEKTLMIPEIIEDFAQKIEFASNDMAVKFYPLGKKKAIVVDPNHQFGSPIIKGTNIKANTISEMYDAGDSVKMLSVLYNLEVSSIRDAVKYCHRRAS